MSNMNLNDSMKSPDDKMLEIQGYINEMQAFTHEYQQSRKRENDELIELRAELAAERAKKPRHDGSNQTDLTQNDQKNDNGHNDRIYGGGYNNRNNGGGHNDRCDSGGYKNRSSGAYYRGNGGRGYSNPNYGQNSYNSRRHSTGNNSPSKYPKLSVAVTAPKKVSIVEPVRDNKTDPKSDGWARNNSSRWGSAAPQDTSASGWGSGTNYYQPSPSDSEKNIGASENASSYVASSTKTVATAATSLAGPDKIENINPTNSAVVSLPSVKPSVSLTNLHYKRVEKLNLWRML